MVRRGEWTDTTGGICAGYVQSNLAIVPKEYAFEFMLFCYRNPQPCPVIDLTEPGNPHPPLLAPEADIRTDLPRYKVFKDGALVDEPTDIKNYWRDDLVSFLLGCSYSFEWSLSAARIEYRLIGVYTSNIQCLPVGRFAGPIAVTLRLIKGTAAAVRAVQISSRMPAVHGKPLHIGNPEAIGINDIYNADLFHHPDVSPQTPDEIPVYWGCGITPQLIALQAKLPLMITHWGGHMFVTDRQVENLAIL
ncbi:MAG: DUF1445 domain-containing protein [Desulfobacteraceae bacterium]|nr:DUF1445 domain-containing protein [Desulfobacteraceae bacterium]